jgi:hypothetical protein
MEVIFSERGKELILLESFTSLHGEELQCKNIRRRKSERFISPSPQSGPAAFYPNAITAAIQPSPFQVHFKREI